jgi:hypothetical protein
MGIEKGTPVRILTFLAQKQDVALRRLIRVLPRNARHSGVAPEQL